MAREGMLSKIALVLGGVVALLVMAIVVLGWYQQHRGSHASPVSPGHPSSAGWNIRYIATLALAHRGSDAIVDCIDQLEEMLDETRQLGNARVKLKNGKESVDEGQAYQTLTLALKAVGDLHQRKPGLDLKRLFPAIDKLAQSTNPPLRTEAQRTKIALGIN
jgi:hypothetical protein